MKFAFGLVLGGIVGLLLGGYGSAFLFFDDFMNAPPPTVKKVPALPLDEIPSSQGGPTPTLGVKDKPKPEQEKEDKPAQQPAADKPKPVPAQAPSKPAVIADPALRIDEDGPPPPPPPARPDGAVPALPANPDGQ
ncbi:MAG: hypothetical protein JO317_03970 [Verrucomicrobiae bacterium]|nr:hypothetical protein [Verrucomicrobiae bacterium]